MTGADTDVLNFLHDYYRLYKKYPEQVEVTPELLHEMSHRKFYFHIFEEEETTCVITRTQPTFSLKRGYQEVTVPVVEVGDPIVLGKPFTIQREHCYPLLAKQQARLAFYQHRRDIIQQGLRIDNVEEESDVIDYVRPTFVYRIRGFVYGSFDLLEDIAS